MAIDGEDNQREVPYYLLVFSGTNSGTRTSSSHPTLSYYSLAIAQMGCCDYRNLVA